MITAVRLVDDSHGSLVVSVSHRKFGEVINYLAAGPKDSLLLEEAKPTYHARFINEFVPLDTRTTCLTITAEVRLKGWRRLASPFVDPIIRRQLEKRTLDPLRQVAELEAERMSGDR
jgi:hypothetical protein